MVNDAVIFCDSPFSSGYTWDCGQELGYPKFILGSCAPRLTHEIYEVPEFLDPVPSIPMVCFEDSMFSQLTYDETLHTVFSKP